MHTFWRSDTSLTSIYSPYSPTIQMEAIRDQIISAVEFPIDYQGQKSVHRQQQVFLYVSVIASVFVGFICQSLILLLGTLLGSVLVISFLTLPAWSTYNKNKVTWLKVKYDL